MMKNHNKELCAAVGHKARPRSAPGSRKQKKRDMAVVSSTAGESSESENEFQEMMDQLTEEYTHMSALVLLPLLPLPSLLLLYLLLLRSLLLPQESLTFCPPCSLPSCVMSLSPAMLLLLQFWESCNDCVELSPGSTMSLPGRWTLPLIAR